MWSIAIEVARRTGLFEDSNVVNFLLKVVLHADDAPGPVVETSPHTPLQIGLDDGTQNGDTGLCEWASCRERCPVCHPLLSTISRKGNVLLLHSELDGWPSPIEMAKEVFSEALPEDAKSGVNIPLLQTGVGWCCLQR